jgi:alpha-L-fucosidase 2
MRLVIGLGEQTGWSLAHMAGVYARMQDGDRALECLDLLSRSCVMNNFFTTHNDWRQMGVGLKMEWAPFQIDANMGWSAAVQQMLMSSTPGRILILPALPARWRAGSVKGLVACGGVEVSISWDAATVEVGLLSAGKDQVVKIVPPFGAGNNVAVELLADQPRTLSFSRKPAGTPGVLALA